jgi:hypothetical protein
MWKFSWFPPNLSEILRDYLHLLLLNISLTFEIDKTKYQNHYFILEDFTYGIQKTNKIKFRD